jgi:hypothetical protein
MYRAQASIIPKRNRRRVLLKQVPVLVLLPKLSGPLVCTVDCTWKENFILVCFYKSSGFFLISPRQGDPVKRLTGGGVCRVDTRDTISPPEPNKRNAKDCIRTESRCPYVWYRFHHTSMIIIDDKCTR